MYLENIFRNFDANKDLSFHHHLIILIHESEKKRSYENFLAQFLILSEKKRASLRRLFV